ncbi:hypothetical protein HDU97_004728 [Phlyctochytrium planicorne]|nr:hypothetical protein HDU97_004728 [Phlyctochytrium planicorne]
MKVPTSPLPSNSQFPETLKSLRYAMSPLSSTPSNNGIGASHRHSRPTFYQTGSWRGLLLIVLVGIQLLIVFDTRRLVKTHIALHPIQVAGLDENAHGVDQPHLTGNINYGAASVQNLPPQLKPEPQQNNGKEQPQDIITAEEEQEQPNVVFKLSKEDVQEAKELAKSDSRFKDTLFHTEKLKKTADAIMDAGGCKEGFLPDVIGRRRQRENVIPNVVNQIWANPTNSTHLPIFYEAYTHTWKSATPSPKYILTDLSHTTGLDYVKSHFSPPIVQAFERLLRPDVTPELSAEWRAKFLKYLILYHEGGVVTDVETERIEGAEMWKMGRQGVKIIFGKEPSQRKYTTNTASFSLTPSTIASMPRHPLLQLLIKTISTLIRTEPSPPNPTHISSFFTSEFLGAIVKSHIQSSGIVGAFGSGLRKDGGDDGWDENCGIGRQYLDVLVLGSGALGSRKALEESSVKKAISAQFVIRH